MSNHTRQTAYIAATMVLAINFSPTPVFAEKYLLSLTRVEANLYKVDGQNFYVMTKYCYEYAYSENAIVDTDTREVIFTGSISSKCDLNMILQKVG